jgi:hypothetical protein
MGGIMMLHLSHKPAVASSNIVSSGLQFNLLTAPPTGNTWTDSTGNGYDATLNGNTVYFANNGGGIKLQNSTYAGDAYISVPYNISTNTVTVELVASFNPTSFWSTIWGNEIYNTGSGYFAYMTSNTSITYGKPNSSSVETITANNSIRHWTFVIDGTAQSLYLNGTQVGTSDTVIAQTTFPTNSFYFGARHTNTGTGPTDRLNSSNTSNQPVFYQMRIYNRALSGAEITTNYDAIKTIYGI